MLILYNLFQWIKARRIFPRSFYEVNISLRMQPKTLEEIKTKVLDWLSLHAVYRCGYNHFSCVGRASESSTFIALCVLLTLVYGACSVTVELVHK